LWGGVCVWSARCRAMDTWWSSGGAAVTRAKADLVAEIGRRAYVKAGKAASVAGGGAQGVGLPKGGQPYSQLPRARRWPRTARGGEPRRGCEKGPRPSLCGRIWRPSGPATRPESVRRSVCGGRAGAPGISHTNTLDSLHCWRGSAVESPACVLDSPVPSTPRPLVGGALATYGRAPLSPPRAPLR
jgi:hypothetical protein